MKVYNTVDLFYGATLGVKPIEAHQDDLFDPMLNSALLTAYDGASDETEGTGDSASPRRRECHNRAICSSAATSTTTQTRRTDNESVQGL